MVHLGKYTPGVRPFGGSPPLHTCTSGLTTLFLCAVHKNGGKKGWVQIFGGLVHHTSPGNSINASHCHTLFQHQSTTRGNSFTMHELHSLSFPRDVSEPTGGGKEGSRCDGRGRGAPPTAFRMPERRSRSPGPPSPSVCLAAFIFLIWCNVEYLTVMARNITHLPLNPGRVFSLRGQRAA